MRNEYRNEGEAALYVDMRKPPITRRKHKGAYDGFGSLLAKIAGWCVVLAILAIAFAARARASEQTPETYTLGDGRTCTWQAKPLMSHYVKRKAIHKPVATATPIASIAKPAHKRIVAHAPAKAASEPEGEYVCQNKEALPLTPTSATPVGSDDATADFTPIPPIGIDTLPDMTITSLTFADDVSTIPSSFGSSFGAMPITSPSPSPIFVSYPLPPQPPITPIPEPSIFLLMLIGLGVVVLKRKKI